MGPTSRPGAEACSGFGGVGLVTDCDRRRAPRARVSVSLGGGAPSGSGKAPIQVELNPALPGAGLFAAFLIRVFGLGGIALAGEAGTPFGSTLRGTGWDALVVGLLALGAIRSNLVTGRTAQRASALVLLAGATAFLVVLALDGAGAGAGLENEADWASRAGRPFACGAVLGACAVPAVIAWVSLYARADLWGMVFHLAGSLLVAGVLYFVSALWTGTGAGALTCTTLLAVGSCALLFAARVPEPNEASPTTGNPVGTEDGIAADSAEHEPDRSRRARRDTAAFLRGQWIPMAGICMLAFIHGLRWISSMLGLTHVKPYGTQGWEFALGPFVALALVWFLLFHTPGRSAAPQRAACQVLIPIAAAVLLVVPILNPLFGFYVGVDTTRPG